MVMYLENQKAKIYVNENVVEGSRMAIILIHGLCEHSGRYLDFIKDLNDNGISIFAMDLRGHGQTLGKRGDSESIAKVLSDVKTIITYVKAKYNFQKVGIFGHSVGGLVASLYTSKYGEDVDFLVLSSPAIYCPKNMRIMKFVPYKLLQFIYIKKKYSESQEMLKYSMQDEFALHKFSIRTIGVFFVAGISILNKTLNISCPTLLACGKLDPLLNETQKFVDFMSKLDNKRNCLKVYDNAKHRIVQNEGAKKRIEDIVLWLKALQK